MHEVHTWKILSSPLVTSQNTELIYPHAEHSQLLSSSAEMSVTFVLMESSGQEMKGETRPGSRWNNLPSESRLYDCFQIVIIESSDPTRRRKEKMERVFGACKSGYRNCKGWKFSIGKSAFCTGCFFVLHCAFFPLESLFMENT